MGVRQRCRIVNGPYVALTNSLRRGVRIRALVVDARDGAVRVFERTVTCCFLITKVVWYAISTVGLVYAFIVVARVFRLRIAKAQASAFGENRSVFGFPAVDVCGVVCHVRSIRFVSPSFSRSLSQVGVARRLEDDVIIMLDGFEVTVEGVRSSAVIRLASAISPIRYRFPAADARVNYVLREEAYACRDEGLRAQDRRSFYVALVPIRRGVRAVARRVRIRSSVHDNRFFPDGTYACRVQWEISDDCVVASERPAIMFVTGARD